MATNGLHLNAQKNRPELKGGLAMHIEMYSDHTPQQGILMRRTRGSSTGKNPTQACASYGQRTKIAKERSIPLTRAG